MIFRDKRVIVICRTFDKTMVSFRKIKSPLRMSEVIVRQIEQKILFGELKPNSILPSENELTKQFGVSRNTVREALRMLEAHEMIKVKRGSRGGSTITQLTADSISDFLIKALGMGGFSGDSIAQFREALEPSIAEIVASIDLDPEFISEMEKNISETKIIYERDEVTGYKNMDFHVILASSTKNPMFIIILKTLRVVFYRITPTSIRKKHQGETLKFHQKILEAIKDRNPMKAKILMEQHMVHLRKALKDIDLNIK
jgi:GntR family transcriptional repressor for pyruvate dehydrogenase complex